MTDFIYWLGDAFYSFFYQFEKLGDIPNWIFVALGFVMLFWWLGLQKKYNDKATQEGSIK